MLIVPGVIVVAFVRVGIFPRLVCVGKNDSRKVCINESKAYTSSVSKASVGTTSG